jgi:hypothetical protein
MCLLSFLHDRPITTPCAGRGRAVAWRTGPRAALRRAAAARVQSLKEVLGGDVGGAYGVWPTGRACVSRRAAPPAEGRQGLPAPLRHSVTTRAGPASAAPSHRCRAQRPATHWPNPAGQSARASAPDGFDSGCGPHSGGRARCRAGPVPVPGRAGPARGRSAGPAGSGAQLARTRMKGRRIPGRGDGAAPDRRRAEAPAADPSSESSSESDRLPRG